jgi:hypothetical protein
MPGWWLERIVGRTAGEIELTTSLLPRECPALI